MLMFFGLCLLAMQAIASGKINGKVTDGKNNESVIGATVLIKGTANGTVADVDGNFSLVVAPGTYTVVVMYMGYQTKEVDGVQVTEGNVTSLNVALTEPKSTDLQEVVVRSSFQRENINTLYMLQRNAATVSDGISADVIRKSPDRSTGEVLKRVSGTTIQDNKYVIVRGLSDRYNTALVDNAVLPSTEPNRKAFSFDIIPSNLIDNIIISKSATPDLPGDFAGGIINILTREIPDQNFNSISLGASYNTVSTFQQFRSGYRSSTDILGFDNGQRTLPSTLPTTTEIAGGKLTQPQQTSAINMLNNNFSIGQRSALPGFNLQASLGRLFMTKNNGKLGVIAAVTYGHSENIIRDARRQYGDFNYNDNTYKYSSTLGGMLNVGYTSGKSKITFKNLYNRVFDDNFLFREGFNNSNSTYINYYAYDLVQKSLIKTSLEGDHQIGTGQGKFNWVLGFNRITNDQPDQRKVSYQQNNATPDAPFTADITSSGKSNNRFFGALQENIYSANLNYSMPFTLGTIKTTFKAGAFGQYRDRTFDARFIGLVLNNNVPNQNIVRQSTIEDLFSQRYIDSNYYRLEENTLPSDQYTATTSTGAGYLMLDNKFTEKLRLVWGVRVEAFNVMLNSQSLAGLPITVDKTWIDILPSANFTYALTEKSNLRASYYKTLARPELREMAPFAYYDYELSALSLGNTALERSQIHNADLRYEIFPAAGEIFSASVFYKKFLNPLEYQVYDANSQLEISITNYPSAENIGAEMELRKKLDFIPGALFRNLTFYTNLAYIASSVADSNGARPLTGQSNYVINTSLGYTAVDGKLNFNVLFNRIGQRIFLVGGQSRFQNAWEMPRNLLDFQVAYNVSKRSEFRFNARDLLNAPVTIYFDQNNNKKFDGVQLVGDGVDVNQDMILQQYRPGTTLSLSYTYKF